MNIVTHFKKKDVTASGNVVIEGWANRATVDRGNDLINKDAWDLENFKKIPMILFNHDKDKPIGKALGIEATDDGLYIKAQISKSQDPFVSYVRDMISEGILNAFSVGFNSKNAAKDSTGVNEITSAELYEVSVVTLPMNQDSTFTISKKDLTGMSYSEAKKKVLVNKGANFAAAIQGALDEHANANDKFDKTTVLATIAEACGMTSDELGKVIAGNSEPTDECVTACANGLGLDHDKLSEVATSDKAKVAEDKKPSDNNPSTQPAKDSTSEGAQSDAGKKKPSEGDKNDNSEESTGKKGSSTSTEETSDEESAGKKIGSSEKSSSQEIKPTVQAVKVPKDLAASAEDAAALVKEAGFDETQPSEDDSYFIFTQVSADSFSATVDVPIDDDDGVMACVGFVSAEVEDTPLEEAGETPEEEAAEDAGKKKTKDVTDTNDNPYLIRADKANVFLASIDTTLKSILETMKGSAEKPAPTLPPKTEAPATPDKASAEVSQEGETESEGKGLSIELMRAILDLNNRIKNLET